MIPTRLLDQTVTILARDTSGTDDWGRAVETWPEPGVDVRGRLELATGAEETDDQDVQTSRWRLFLKPDVTISGRDRVRADGVTYEVDGPPTVQRTPRGPHHLQVSLRAVQ